MAQEDGAIYINTTINTDGVEAGARDIKSALKNIVSILTDISNLLKGFSGQVAQTFGDASKQIQQTENSLESVNEAAENLEGKNLLVEAEGIDETKAAVEDFSDEVSEIGESAEASMKRARISTELLKEGLAAAIQARDMYLEAGGYKIGDYIKSKEIDIENLKKQLEDAGVSTEEFFKKEKAAANNYTNELKAALEKAKETLDGLEGQGFWWGDEEYEKAAKEVARLENAAKLAKKEVLSPEPDANPFGLDTMSGKIVDLEIQLRKLVDTGKGLGDPAYDEVYRKFALAKAEAKQYAAELAKTPEQIQKEADALAAKEAKAAAAQQKEAARIEAINRKLEEQRAKEVAAAEEADRLTAIADNAKVSNQRIVSLNTELERLKQRMADLKAAGIGIGYEEYEELSRRIDEIVAELKEYESELGKSEKAASRFGGILSGIKTGFDKIASAAKRTSSGILGFGKNVKKTDGSIATSIKSILKYAIGVRSLYALFGKMRTAAKEGFSNLAQYSGDTNASISSLMSALTKLKNSLATAFNPVLTVVQPILTHLINLLSEVTNRVGMFIAAMTGQSTFTKAVAVQEDYAAGLKDTAGAAEDAEKAIKGYLSPLDEINKYDSNTSSSSGAGASGSTGVNPSDMFETVEIEDKISEFAEKAKQTLTGMFAPLKQSWDEYEKSIKGTLALIRQDFVDFGVRIRSSSITWFQNLDWSPLMKSVDNLLASLEPLTDTILDGLGWAWENILLPLGQWTIEEGIPAFFDTLAGAFTLIDAVAENVGEMLAYIWDNFLSHLVGFVGDAVVSLFETLGTVLTDIANNETAVNVLSGVAVAILAIVAAITAWTIIQGILNILLAASPLTWIVLAITAVIAAIVLAITYWDEIKEAIQTFWDKCVEIFSGIGDWFKEKFENAWKNIKIIWLGATLFFQSIGDGIKNVFGSIGTWFKERFQSAWNNVKIVWSGVTMFFKGVWDGITGAFGNITGWFKDKFTAAWAAVKKVFSTGGKVFSGITDGILSSFKSVVNTLITGINQVVAIPFNGINTALNTLKGINILGAKPFSWISTISVPKIPYLASGAVIPPNAPFMAVLGDQKRGNNLETPEALLRKIVREESGAGQQGGGNYRFTVQINRRTVFDEVIEEAKLRQMNNGKNPFELA